MDEKIRGTRFWQYFKISLLSTNDSNGRKKFTKLREKKRNFGYPSRQNHESRTTRSNLRLPAFVLRSHFQTPFSPLTERSSWQQRARGCTRGGYRGRVSSPRAGTRDARESRSTRWPRRDERVPRVERVAFGWLANGSGKSRGRTPEGSRGVTLAPASMA